MSVARKIAAGATWMVGFRVLERSLGLVSTVVLARVLVPEDFGLVAMAMSIVALIELAGAFSLEAALIQRAQPTREHYDTTWTLNLLFGAGCALATAALSLPAAQFFSDARLVPVMLVLAAGWLVQSFENVGIVNFRRELEFAPEFRFFLAKKLAAVSVTLALAFALRSYWALVAGIVVGRVTGVVLSYAMQPYRPRFSLAARRDLMSFSIWLFVNNLLGFVSARLAHLVIGRLHGAPALGLFTIGAEVALLPSSELVAPIHRAVFPGFSRMAQTLGGLREGMLRVVAATALIAVPACVGLAAVAEPLVLTVLGAQWTAAVPVVQIMAMVGVLHVLTANNHSAYLALGKTRIPAAIGAAHVVVLIALLAVLAPAGIAGIALAQLGAALASVVPSYYFAVRLLELELVDLWRALWRPFAASAAMGGALVAIAAHAEPWLGPLAAWAMLLLQIGAGATVYTAAVLALWTLVGRPAGAEAFFLDLLRRRPSFHLP